MAETHTGRCFCGAVEIEATGTPLAMGYCHCGSCRAWSGAPVSAYILWPSEAVKVTRGEALLGRFARTEMNERQFCTRCGGHVISLLPEMGLTDVFPAVMPDVEFRPSAHVHYAETVLPIRDGLPKLKDLPAEAGGSGEVVPE